MSDNHNETKKIPLYQERPEPKFTTSVNEQGQTIKTLVPQSPLSRKLWQTMAGNSVVADQVAYHRGADLIAHREHFRALRPIIEARHGVSGQDLFRGGNAIEAQRLYKASKEDYEDLRESMNY